ncbi:MAG: NUDIX hydrolase [Burkholderiales bacterium]
MQNADDKNYFSDESLVEHTVSSKTEYRGRLLQVKEDRVRLPDGSEANREYIVHPGAVAIIALTDDGKIIMERQYRYPLHQDFIEIPAGKIDEGEEDMVTAQRELQEETGYAASRWRHLITTHPCIGYSNERIEFFLAEGLTLHKHQREHGEFLDVCAMPLQQALAWIREGKITDTKTITGLLWYEKFGR